MKKLLAASILLAFVLVMGASLAMAADTPEQKEIKTYIAQLATLYGSKDVAGELKVVEPKAALKYCDGKKITIEQWAERTKKEVAAYNAFGCKIVPGKIVVKGDKATADFTETDTYKMEVKGKIIEGTIVSAWTLKIKKTKDGWRAYDFLEHSEKNIPKK
jgi:hypothetical protein